LHEEAVPCGKKRKEIDGVLPVNLRGHGLQYGGNLAIRAGERAMPDHVLCPGGGTGSGMTGLVMLRVGLQRVFAWR